MFHIKDGIVKPHYNDSIFILLCYQELGFLTARMELPNQHVGLFHIIVLTSTVMIPLLFIYDY